MNELMDSCSTNMHIEAAASNIDKSFKIQLFSCVYTTIYVYTYFLYHLCTITGICTCICLFNLASIDIYTALLKVNVYRSMDILRIPISVY